MTFRVHLGLYGGPARSDGSRVASNAPQPGASIVLSAADGTKTTRRTDAHGRATFAVLPGRYTVDSPSCGSGPLSIVIRAGRTRRANIRCDIP